MPDIYELLDSGQGKKLERFGSYTIVRPAAQAIWKPSCPNEDWSNANSTFTREGGYRWSREISNEWVVQILGVKFLLKQTGFGHVGVFPEQIEQWQWLLEKLKQGDKILNLFAYSGGATLIAALQGATCCHVDASSGMVSWAKSNVAYNGLQDRPIRWIVDDVFKFLKKELRRGSRYDAIIMDPPTYGKGSRGEVFKFEKHLNPLLELCKKLLSDKALFLLLSCHAPLVTPSVMENVLKQAMQGFSGKVEAKEMLLKGGAGVFPLPSGSFARWSNE